MDLALQNKLIDFLKSVTGRDDITSQTDLIDSGLMDSLTMMDLLVFIESEINVQLDFADINPQKFKSAQTIATLITNTLKPDQQADAA